MRNIQRRKCGFSLVELLVVMGIMGLLFAILLPAIGAVRRSASRAQARQMVRSIESAMLAYQAEYGRFPLQDSSIGRIYNDDQYNETIRILANRPDPDFTDEEVDAWLAQHNPRRQTFLEAEFLSVTDYDASALIEDPWGNRYRIAADWSMQRNVNTGPRKEVASDNTSDGHDVIRNHAVAVWSIAATRPERYGGFVMPDPEDHITSWSQ